MEKIDVERFRFVLRKFERELDKQNNSNCCCGVTIAQCHALLEIDKRGSCNLNELSSALNLDKSTVSRTIDGLVKNGQVKRVIPEENRRTTVLSLTDSGKEASNSINQGNNEYFIEAIQSIPPEIRENFLKGFEMIADKMSDLNKIQ